MRNEDYVAGYCNGIVEGHRFVCGWGGGEKAFADAELPDHGFKPLATYEQVGLLNFSPLTHIWDCEFEDILQLN